jgi:hypothetical protein
VGGRHIGSLAGGSAAQVWCPTPVIDHIPEGGEGGGSEGGGEGGGGEGGGEGGGGEVGGETSGGEGRGECGCG